MTCLDRATFVQSNKRQVNGFFFKGTSHGILDLISFDSVDMDIAHVW